MKKPVLSRYEFADDGSIILDVTATRIEDLFNDFDKMSPYAKKDLDQDFSSYLIDCGREIGSHPFVIRINLATAAGDEPMSRCRMGIRNFFLYQKDLEIDEVRSMLRKSLIFLVIGIGILVLSIRIHQGIAANTSVISRVFAEGLTVAAWVSLWEALATFLIHWTPHRRLIKLYERIANAAVLFRFLGNDNTDSQHPDIAPKLTVCPGAPSPGTA